MVSIFHCCNLRTSSNGGGGLLYRSVEHVLSKLGPNVAYQMKGVLRIPSNVPMRPGIVKAEFSSVEQKISVLRAKSSLKRCPDYTKVFIRTSKSHAERVQELNMKKMLDIIPGGKDFMVSSSGKLVSREEVFNRAKETSQGVDYKRKRVGSTPTSLGPVMSHVPKRAAQPVSVTSQNRDGCYKDGSVSQAVSSPLMMLQTSAVNHGRQNYPHSTYSTPVQKGVSFPAGSSTYQGLPTQDLRLFFTPSANTLQNSEGYIFWIQPTQYLPRRTGGQSSRNSNPG